MARRRGGWGRRGRFGRGEVVPLVVVPDYPTSLLGLLFATAGAAIAGTFRLVWRFRSELAPVAVALALSWFAGRLYNQQQAGQRPAEWLGPWIVTGPATVAATVAVLVLPVVFPQLAQKVARRASVGPRWDRPAERVYTAVVVATAGTWLSLAALFGPDTAPLPQLGIVAGLVVSVPWWAHRRRRAKARVERKLAAWPDLAEAIGLPGSRVLSVLVTRFGYTVRIGLRRGHPGVAAVNATEAIESGLEVRPGAVRVEPDTSRADRVIIRVLETDPHAQPLPWPGPMPGPGIAGVLRAPSITAPVELGVFEDGSPVRVSMLRRNVLVGGVVGSGKSGIVNTALATLTGCPDCEVWGIDLKQGMELGPWADCLTELATTPKQATGLLSKAVARLDRQAALLADTGHRLWEPTPSRPALVIVIDEYAELNEHAHTLTDSIARRGRAVAVNLFAATQRPTQQAMGGGAVRSQMDIRICLRVRERKDTDLILGQGMLKSGWHPHQLDAPGKFLISSPEHHHPYRARGYHLDDDQVRAVATRNAKENNTNKTRPNTSPAKPTEGIPDTDPDTNLEADADIGLEMGPEMLLWMALNTAPEHGVTLDELMNSTGRGRRWIYYRIEEHIKAGRVVQTYRGRWRATSPPASPATPPTEPPDPGDGPTVGPGM